MRYLIKSPKDRHTPRTKCCCNSTFSTSVHHSLAAVRSDCQHAERHVPDPVRVRREVVSLPLLPAPRAAEVRAVDSLKLVHVVVLGALGEGGEEKEA